MSEDKQRKTYRVLIITLAIHATGCALGWWGDKYFWWIICTVAFVMPLSILINIWWRKWK